MNTETTDLTFQDWLEIRNRKLSRDREPVKQMLSAMDYHSVFIAVRKAKLASDNGTFFDVTYYEWLIKMKRKIAWDSMISIYLPRYRGEPPIFIYKQLRFGIITPIEAGMRLWAWEYEHPNLPEKKKKGRPVKVASR